MVEKKGEKKKFWSTTFTLTGTVIGAGILGLPYVFSKSGFLVGFLWLLFLGGVVLFTSLCLGEVALRTKGRHHVAGYAEKYLGKFGKKVMFFAIVFGIYSALLAYLIGEGQSFSKLVFGSVDYAVYFAIGFWFIMTLLLKEGLKELKKIETWGVMAIIVLVLMIFAWFFPGVKVDNLEYVDLSNLFLPFGVILFALLGFTSIPELRMEIEGSEKKLKKAIIYGMVLPIFLYSLFAFVFVGVLGNEVSELATLSFGNLVTLLGIFTMLTSYFVLSFALKDTFKFDMNFSKKWNFLFVSLAPLLIYLIVVFFDIGGFVKILGIGGVVSGGLTGLLILVMNMKAKKMGNRKPEYNVPLGWIAVGLLGLVFVFGILLELFGSRLFG